MRVYLEKIYPSHVMHGEETKSGRLPQWENLRNPLEFGTEKTRKSETPDTSTQLSDVAFRCPERDT